MKVIQRVSEGACTIDGEMSGSIAEGLVVLAGFTHGDTKREVEWMAEKIVNLRILKMNKGNLINLCSIFRAGCCLFRSLHCMGMLKKADGQALQKRPGRRMLNRFIICLMRTPQ